MTSASPLSPSFNPASPSTEVKPTLNCCDQPELENPKTCSLCNANACAACAITVNDAPTCDGCYLLLRDEVANQTPKLSTLPPAIAGGFVGAALGGLAWAIIAMVTRLEVGYVAIAIGWIAGQGVVLGSGSARGRGLQCIAALSSALGLVFGRYFSYAWEVVEHVKATSGEVLSYFDYRIVDSMLENFTGFFGVWDVLWLALGLSVAWKLPAPKKCELTPQEKMSQLRRKSF